MKPLLSQNNRIVLEQLASRRVLVAFDFDGTLAPIVSARESACMRSSTTALLEQLCELYPCAVISGRARGDVIRRLGSAKVKYVVGNHGLEPGKDLERFAVVVAIVRKLLDHAFEESSGIEFEDKRYSIALHYRKSKNKARARDQILQSISSLPVPMRVVTGKLIVNLIPEGAPNKGQALLDLSEAEGADWGIYVGDDITDEDVFQLEPVMRLLTVRVGVWRGSSAHYYIREQRDVDMLLKRLVSLRAGAL